MDARIGGGIHAPAGKESARDANDVDLGEDDLTRRKRMLEPKNEMS